MSKYSGDCRKDFDITWKQTDKLLWVQNPFSGKVWSKSGPRVKFCSNFKVLRIWQNLCHCIRLIFLIPAVYLLSQTESVWRRYLYLFTKPNRQKFDVDCTCLHSPYGLTWQDRTGRTVMTWQLFIGWLLANQVMTRVWLVANNMRTHGPIHGRHVSLSLLVYVLCKM